MARLVVALAMVFVAGCTSHLHGYQDAVHAWRFGDPDLSVANARAEYARFRDGNDLDEQRLRALVDAARVALEETPLAAGVTVDGPTDVEEPLAVGAELGPPNALRDQLRADLLSGRATAMLRAANAAKNLGLDAMGFDLLTVIFSRDPVADDGGLLAGESTAIRSVAAKRMALDSLEVLATQRRR